METLDRIESLPGVTSAGAVSAAPFLEADIAVRRSFVIDGVPQPPEGQMPQAYVVSATEGYFPTMSVPVLAGRIFTPSDRLGAPVVAVINESMRRRFWPDGDAIGEAVWVGSSDPIEIVGVVGDVRHSGLDDDPRPELFFPHRQTGGAAMTYFVRTVTEPSMAIDAVQREVWAVEPLQAFYRTATMDELFSKTLKPRRFTMLLLTSFAVMAVLMAAVGIYGVVSFHVSSRRQEIGVRLALGASRSDLVKSVVGRGMSMVGVGLVAGVIGSWALTRTLSSFLYGVSPLDATTVVSAAVVMVMVAVLASYVPARGVTRVDPVTALKQE